MTFQRKLICGVGVNDIYDDNIGTKQRPKYYNLWNNMLIRCYSEKYHSSRPTYINCEVDKEWIYLSNFREWFNENYINDYQLDKDLLFPGNKIYGPDKCVFVPRNINQLLTFRNKHRGTYPLGVCLHSDAVKLNPYLSRCSNGKGKLIQKLFPTPKQAHFHYLEQKINIINEYLQEDYSDKIKHGLNKWKQLFQYHIDNQIIFDPNNIMYNL
jgi:hypothetical protein